MKELFTQLLVRRPRATLAILALAKNGPMNMREFIEAVKQAQPQAKLIRDDLESAGLVVMRQQGGHGTIGAKEIRLSPLGEKVGDLLLAVDRLMEGSSERKK